MLLEDFAVGGRLAVGAAGGDRVPLVHEDDDAAAALVRVAADGGVAGGHALGGVDDQQRHVRGFKVTARHDDAELFGHQVGLALAADAGRIDKAELAALELHNLIDCVAGGAGDGRDNGARGSGERIQQGGLAHVGPADDGDRGFMLLKLAVGAMERLRVGCVVFDVATHGTRLKRSAFGDLVFFGLGVFGFEGGSVFFCGCWQRRDRLGDCIEQVADAEAVLGADGIDFANAKLAKVLGHAASWPRPRLC